MKKFFPVMRSLAAMLVAVAAGFVVSACSEDETSDVALLSSPEPTIVYHASSFTASWAPVEGASGYAYKLDGGEEQSTSQCSLTIEGLEFGSSHTFSIKAVSSSGMVADSYWSNFTIDLKNAFKFGPMTLKSNGESIDSFTVSWTAVENAEYYEVSLDEGDVTTTEETSMTFTGVSSGMHTVKVRPATSNPDYMEAEWTSIDVSTVVSADAAGHANCFLLSSGGVYTFDVAYLNNPDIAGMELLWQDQRGLVTSVSLDGQTAMLHVANGIYGNALVAATDADGEVVWSWHIWVPEAAVEEVALKSGYRMMNMNLGAVNNNVADVGSYGMLYQWGRKDPFPTASTLTGNTSTVAGPLYDIDGNEVTIGYVTTSATVGTIEYATAHPTVCIASGLTQTDWLAVSDDALWGNPYGNERDTENNYPNKGEKSQYDPCPAGWRVPPADVFRSFTSSGGYAWVVDDFDVADMNGDGTVDEKDWNYGWLFNVASGSNYFSAGGRYYGAYGMLYGSVVGLYGNYWGNCPYNQYGFSVLAFQNSAQGITCSPAAAGSRSDGFAIRCIADK